MFKQATTIKNPTGLHARPASQLTAFCKKFPEKITIEVGGSSIDPKSIISLLSAGIKCGTEVNVIVEGENENLVGEELIAFINGLTE